MYTLAAMFTELLSYSDTITKDDVLGFASMLFWAFLLGPTIKYCVFALTVTFNGHGGTFALLGCLRQDHVWGILPRFLKRIIYRLRA